MYIFFSLLVVASWGFNSVVSKIGVTNFPVFLFFAIRFFCTGLLFLPFVKFQKKDLANYFKIGLSFNVFHIGFIGLSLYFLTASSSATIQQIQTPMAILLSVIVLKERISIIQVLGMLVAIGGVVIIYGLPEVNFVGFCFTIVSALFFAVAQILLKKSGKMHMPSFVAFSSLFSVPFLLMLSYFFDRRVDFETVDYTKVLIPLGYQVFILGFSTAIWQKLIATHGVSKINPINLLSVVFAIMSGVLILGEKLTLHMAIGALVIVLGVAVSVLFKKGNK